MRMTLTPIVVFLAVTSYAQQADPGKAATATVLKVAGSVSMIRDEGGNIAVSAGDDGMVLAGDRFAPLDAKLKEVLKTISTRPVRFAIKTSGPADPAAVSGLAEREGTIVAHENVRKQLRTTKARGSQMVTYTDHAAIHLNGEEIRLHHFPGGYTGGDTIVQFTQSNVVHMGGNFILFSFPPVDRENGGSVKGMIAAIEAILKQTDKETLFIPGHGVGFGDWPVMDSYRDALKGTVAILNEAIQGGKTLEQIQKEKTLVAWEHLASDSVSLEKYTEGLYYELKGASSKAE